MTTALLSTLFPVITLRTVSNLLHYEPLSLYLHHPSYLDLHLCGIKNVLVCLSFSLHLMEWQRCSRLMGLLCPYGNDGLYGGRNRAKNKENARVRVCKREIFFFHLHIINPFLWLQSPSRVLERDKTGCCQRNTALLSSPFVLSH